MNMLLGKYKHTNKIPSLSFTVYADAYDEFHTTLTLFLNNLTLSPKHINMGSYKTLYTNESYFHMSIFFSASLLASTGIADSDLMTL